MEYKVIIQHFWLALTDFNGYSHFNIRDLENIGQGHEV